MRLIKTRSSLIRERIAHWEDEKFMMDFMIASHLGHELNSRQAWIIVCIERLINRLYKKLNRK